MNSGFEFDANLYLKLIAQINDRFSRLLLWLSEAEVASASKNIQGRDYRLEECFLQLRLIIESIIASSFVVHRRAFIQLFGKPISWSKPDELRKKLSRINRSFMPFAVKTGLNSSGGVSYEYLSPQQGAEDLMRLHGWCGNYLHVRDPNQREIHIRDIWCDLDAFLSWMNGYLAGHIVSFYAPTKICLFDGAGIVSGVPALFDLDATRQKLTFSLVPVSEK